MHTLRKGNGADRRRHTRISISERVLKGSEFKALDLSEGGMKLEASKAYASSKPVSLTLNLNGEVVDLQAKVMRCQESSSIFNSNYLLGVMFVNIKASDVIKIRQYLEPYRRVAPSVMSA